jgi:gamma-glutamylcyclotransferase (GGCT)/AIG2-like uncharacterized protein YtfP
MARDSSKPSTPPGAGTWPADGPYDVFVYGTLKPGGIYWQTHVRDKAVASMPAMVRGKLYHLPHRGYPGLLCEPIDTNDSPSWVHGYIHRFEERQRVLALDELEGYAPDRPVGLNEYQRRFVPVFDLKREPFATVWTYVMSAQQIKENEGQWVTSGDWVLAKFQRCQTGDREKE